jgi:hypothetical protein
MQALMTVIVLWLSINFEMPANYEHPRIEFAPAHQIGALHYQSFLSTQPVPLSATGNGAIAPKESGQVVAFYNSVTKTIYLPDTWSPESAAGLSVLVHEMVHHLQHVGNIKYECPQAREQPAFFAQERWLRMFGSDLAEAFEIDTFSLLVRTACAH